MAKDTLSVTDNRTGKHYEIPIEEGGVIRATALREIKTAIESLSQESYGICQVCHDLIGQAAARAGERTTFAAADAETYVPPSPFDAVVFNECVYYFNDPVGSVQRYEPYLTDGGCFVVSTFRSRRADVIAQRLAAIYTLLEETAITNRKGTWVVRIFKP